MEVRIHMYTHAEGLQFFCQAILSQNHRGIDIAELILVNMKVVIVCTKGSPINDIMGILLT